MPLFKRFINFMNDKEIGMYLFVIALKFSFQVDPVLLDSNLWFFVFKEVKEFLVKYLFEKKIQK